MLAGVDADPPDVVLTGIRMPPTHTDEGIPVADRLGRSHRGLGVVVLSQHLNPTDPVRLFERGTAVGARSRSGLATSRCCSTRCGRSPPGAAWSTGMSWNTRPGILPFPASHLPSSKKLG